MILMIPESQRPRSRPGITCVLALLVIAVCGLVVAPPQLRAEVFLRANQVGYSTHDPKIAIAFSTTALPDTFDLIEVGSGARVFEGTTVALAGQRWGKFDHHAELDFTQVTRQGRYVLRLGEARSLPFAIGGTGPGRLARRVARVHAPAALRLQSLAAREVPPAGWPDRLRPLTGWDKDRRPRRLARRCRLAEVPPDLRQRHGPDASGL